MSYQTGFFSRPGASLARALIVTRRELRDTMRDWRVLAPIITLVIILPFILASILSALSPQLIKNLGQSTFHERLLPFTTLAIGFLPMSFCLVIALETFVGEKERNSLEALLSAPLTDFELFLGKYLAATLPTVLASIFGSLSFSFIFTLMGQPFPVSPDLLLIFLALNGVEALVMVAGAVLISTHTTSVRAANIMASFIILPMSICVQLEAVLLLNNLQAGLYLMLLGLVVILALLMRSGVKIFNREEIISREGDNVSFKGILRGFGYYFRRTPQEALAHQKTGQRWTIWRFYRRDIPQLLGLYKSAILVVAISIAGGILVCIWVAYWPVVRDFRDALNLGDRLTGTQNPICQSGTINSITIGGFQGVTWQGLFINNTVSVLLGSGLSLISLGVAGILLLIISTGPVGFILGFFFQLDLNPWPLLAGFILPHGIFELPAVIIGIAAALKISTSVIAPPENMNLGQSFQFAIVNYIKLLGLIVPLLLIAAIIEANITPAIGCWLTGGTI
ncbi:MAG: stage II sporulation protein M [Chloroflexi bacterium]|nr:stage II sporulation protein M [Chloroflexota bacterium]OJV94412.1 MAG: hypothetical protein BGO39_21875 [Chloroflexi bacterium 54-19]